MNPAQNRTGSASAPSQASHAVDPAGRPAAHAASSTLFPAPADPTTTVSRFPAPADNRPPSTPRGTSVDGKPAGPKITTANRAVSAIPPPANPDTPPPNHEYPALRAQK